MSLKREESRVYPIIEGLIYGFDILTKKFAKTDYQGEYDDPSVRGSLTRILTRLSSIEISGNEKEGDDKDAGDNEDDGDNEGEENDKDDWDNEDEYIPDYDSISVEERARYRYHFNMLFYRMDELHPSYNIGAVIPSIKDLPLIEVHNMYEAYSRHFRHKARLTKS